MKMLASVIFLFGLSAQAAPIKYSVNAYTWCNGPTNNGACPYSYWQRIELNHLKTVTVDISAVQQTIELADDVGIWKLDLTTCNSKLTDPTGCVHSLDSSDPDNVSIGVTEWTYGLNPQDILIKIVNQNEIQILDPQNMFFVLDVKKLGI